MQENCWAQCRVHITALNKFGKLQQILINSVLMPSKDNALFYRSVRNRQTCNSTLLPNCHGLPEICIPYCQLKIFSTDIRMRIIVSESQCASFPLHTWTMLCFQSQTTLTSRVYRSSHSACAVQAEILQFTHLHLEQSVPTNMITAKLLITLLYVVEEKN